jgi:hypothetical protein
MQGITNPSMMEMQAYEKMPLETIESFELIMDPTGPLNVAFAAMHSAMPNIDALLGRAVRGTNLLKGKPDDYALSLVMAMAFPLVQFALDRTVFDVSVACSSAPFLVFCRAFVGQFQERSFRAFGNQDKCTLILTVVGSPCPWVSSIQEER